MSPTNDGLADATPAAWSAPQRVAFRFGFIYLGLYALPWVIKRPLLPDWRKAAESCGSFEGAVRWFGHHVLGVAGPLVKEYPGGGDSSFQWVRVALLVLVALLGTVVWSALDRKRTGYPLLLDLLRVYVRYGLALTMMYYGIVKVFPIQFAPPTFLHLFEPLGDMSPMDLLWSFMGFSRLYTLFAGLVELVGGVLLFWRRTTFLGALLVAIATTNVLLLNLSYDVPVKLFSAHLLVMAVFLAAPDGARVLRFLLRREPTELPPLREPLPWARVNRARPWVKAAVVSWCSFATVFFTVEQGRATPPMPAPALLGAWVVESYGPSTPTGSSWHRLLIDEWRTLTVERIDGQRTRFALEEDPSASTISVSNGTKKMVFEYARQDADRLVLDGDVEGVPVSLHLRRNAKDFVLTSRGFHWVQEAAFFR